MPVKMFVLYSKLIADSDSRAVFVVVAISKRLQKDHSMTKVNGCG